MSEEDRARSEASCCAWSHSFVSKPGVSTMMVLRLMACARNPHPTSEYDTQVFAFHDLPSEAVEVRTWPSVFHLRVHQCISR